MEVDNNKRKQRGKMVVVQRTVAQMYRYGSSMLLQMLKSSLPSIEDIEKELQYEK